MKKILLLWSATILIGFALIIPYLPGAALLELEPLPIGVLGALIAITLAYAATTEIVKRWFYSRTATRRRRGRRRLDPHQHRSSMA